MRYKGTKRRKCIPRSGPGPLERRGMMRARDTKDSGIRCTATFLSTANSIIPVSSNPLSFAGPSSLLRLASTPKGLFHQVAILMAPQKSHVNGWLKNAVVSQPMKVYQIPIGATGLNWEAWSPYSYLPSYRIRASLCGEIGVARATSAAPETFRRPSDLPAVSDFMTPCPSSQRRIFNATYNLNKYEYT
ncbi:hypothetical protein ACRALDRAFT_212581 [Sodiomyces alcalophilus JCM 7366]|uniref:uncharacterized protein n=1 Tax=Sodiomyces alcalophilus JCM 7366 TaxID=591952 RepID=UPI0039B3EBB7